MHITITGRLGSGKSTVCRILADKDGYEIYSTGKIHRQIAAEKGEQLAGTQLPAAARKAQRDKQYKNSN